MSGRWLPWLAVACLSCGEGETGWVAQVDGVSISRAELTHELEARLELDPEQSREEALNQVINELVSERVVLNRARALGIEVTLPEVESRLAQLHGESTRSDPQFLEEVRKEMLLRRTALTDLASEVQVQESALVHHFEEHRDEYNEPERVRVRHIVVEAEARARELLEQLDQGADFASLATQHSLAPEASEGGLLPPFARGEMPEVFERAFDLEMGERSDVIESPYGFHILLLEDRVPAREADLDEVRTRLRSELEQQRLASLEQEWIRNLRRGSEIRVNESALENLR